MNEIESGSRSGVRAPVAGDGQGGGSAEMRRQMEAAKLRMQKSHAVYGRPDGAASGAPASVKLPEER